MKASSSLSVPVSRTLTSLFPKPLKWAALTAALSLLSAACGGGSSAPSCDANMITALGQAESVAGNGATNCGTFTPAADGSYPASDPAVRCALDALAAGTFFFVGTTTGHYFALPFPDDCSPTNTLSDFWTECDAYEGSICTDTVLKQVTCTVTMPSTSCFAPAAESSASQVVCAGSPNGGGIAQ
jgi:hypothetical protein